MSEERYESARGRPSMKYQGTAGGGHGLAQQLSELARSLQAETDPDAVLEEIVSAAVRLIPGVDQGSISVVLGRQSVRSYGASGDLPERIDAIQEELAEGPCLDAVYQEKTVRVPDMAHEQRWPRFAQRAAEAGASSMLAIQLYVDADNLGALNLYGSQRQAFDDESEDVGLLFASHAAVAFADAQKMDHLNHAIASRDLIGQAKGILMERYRLNADQAFLVLTRLSSHQNRKLREVAAEIAHTGQTEGINPPQA